MAHIAKYKATSVGRMLAHYRRDASSLERDNIDPSRVKNDLVVGHYTINDGRLVILVVDVAHRREVYKRR